MGCRGHHAAVSTLDVPCVIRMTHPIARHARDRRAPGHPGGLPGPDTRRHREHDHHAPGAGRAEGGETGQARGPARAAVPADPPGAHHGDHEETAGHAEQLACPAPAARAP